MKVGSQGSSNGSVVLKLYTEETNLNSILSHKISIN